MQIGLFSISLKFGSQNEYRYFTKMFENVTVNMATLQLCPDLNVLSDMHTNATPIHFLNAL